MVFDVNLFTDTLREFEIDLTKMPLGRLSRAQVLKAYRVLTELQQILEKGQDGQVQPVLKIEREVESKRFKKDIGNLHLLWHGSRLSNYVGILSQGLRISPPEAPVTGYMFGKGIYFADMVTKSANYCYVMNGQGLLLLCEVALGDIQEEKNGREIKKPKRGKNSVKGIGGTVPNSDEFENLNGATIPFVVYDEAQIRLKYLVSVKIGSTLL
uniref:Poly [ADP-ribose] polymerase n=1 Tax=Globodera pallida TaxID=36090 RepID=A0A183BWX5_GLOPA